MGLIRKVLYNAGSWIREKGQVIDRLGSRLQGSHYCQEQRVCRQNTRTMFAAGPLGRQNTRISTGKIKQSGDSYDGSFPSHFDWRQKGVVTRVKNQLCYDYCYIFSAIAGIEGVNTIVTNTRHRLSEQQFVDCNRTNRVCCPHERRGRRGRRRRGVGGRIHSVFEYVINNGGISLDKDYPFVGHRMPCKKVWNKLVTIHGYVILPIDEHTLLQAVLQQPVCVGLYISHKDLNGYKEGVYTGCIPTDKKDLAKHAMLIVAFGTRDGKDYWTMKNSWGDDWGQAGYIDVWRKSNVIDYASCPIKLR